jgi:hypothetical protein
LRLGVVVRTEHERVDLSATVSGMSSVTRGALVGIAGAFALTCARGADAHTAPPALDAGSVGILRGIAGRPCSGAPQRVPPPNVRVTVTLGRGTRVVARTTVTDTIRADRSFSFRVAAGRYAVSASNGAKPQRVSITAGKTTNVRIESRVSCA